MNMEQKNALEQNAQNMELKKKKKTAYLNIYSFINLILYNLHNKLQ